jgi:hypothetical protein
MVGKDLHNKLPQKLLKTQCLKLVENPAVENHQLKK